jgi:hypothetical protein
VDVRYAVTLDGKVVGTVALSEPATGRHTARLHPLPAFRAVREARRQLRAADRAAATDRDPTESEMAAEEAGLSALSQLELRLVDERTGLAIPNASVRLLRGEPPRVRVQFWRPEDAQDHHDPAG